MGNLCGVPSITIIIHSREFEDEVCNPKRRVVKPVTTEELSETRGELNFMKVSQL
jgi:hypothetical protein